MGTKRNGSSGCFCNDETNTNQFYPLIMKLILVVSDNYSSRVMIP